MTEQEFYHKALELLREIREDIRSKRGWYETQTIYHPPPHAVQNSPCVKVK